MLAVKNMVCVQRSLLVIWSGMETLKKHVGLEESFELKLIAASLENLICKTAIDQVSSSYFCLQIFNKVEGGYSGILVGMAFLHAIPLSVDYKPTLFFIRYCELYR